MIWIIGVPKPRTWIIDVPKPKCVEVIVQPFPPMKRAEPQSKLVCYRCGGEGHLSKDCKRMSL